MFTYPPKPWFDGQVHQVVTEDGRYITGVYDMSSNTWNLHHGTSGGHAGLVMTPDVKTINTPPTKPIPTGTRISYPNINNQQDANWALQKQIDDIRALTTSIWVGNSLEEPPLGQDGTMIYYLWYQTDNEQLLQYSVQAQEWIPVKGEGAANIAFSSVEPDFPTPFNAWFNTLSKETHIAFNSQWYEISRNKDVTDLMFSAQQLQDEKVSKAGDTMTGGLTITNSRNQTFTKENGDRQFAINPNVTSDYFTNIYSFNGADGEGGVRFRVSQNQNLGSSNYDTLLSLSGETQDIGGTEYRGTLSVNRLRTPGTPDQAANKYYVDEADNDLQGQIDDGLDTQQEIISNIETLQNKVNALEGSVIDAIWTFEEENRAPRNGEFGLRAIGGTATSVWDAATSIVISTTSADGEDYTFEKVTVNDVIRIGAADGTNAEYKVTAIVGPGSYLVEHLRSGGAPTDENEYAFTFLSAFDPEGLATIDYVDQQDNTRIKKAGDTVQGPLNFDTNNTIAEVSGDNGAGTPRRRYLKVRGTNALEIVGYPGQDNSNAKTCFKFGWAQDDTHPSLVIDYLQDPTNNGHPINLRYGLATYMPFSGGTFTGNVNLGNNNLTNIGKLEVNLQSSNGQYFTVKGVKDGSSSASDDFFYAYSNGTSSASAMNYKGRINSEFNLVNKGYVDSEIAGISFDTSDFVTKSGNQAITGTKTFNSGKLAAGDAHNSSTIGINVKGRLQVNGGSGNQGQVLVSRSTSGTVQWRNVVASSSSDAGNGGFYQAAGSLYYVAY